MLIKKSPEFQGFFFCYPPAPIIRQTTWSGLTSRYPLGGNEAVGQELFAVTRQTTAVRLTS